MKIKIYQAVCSTHGEKCWWTVSGGWKDSYEAAVSVANNHAGVRNGAGKIERVDEDWVEEEDWYNPKTY